MARSELPSAVLWDVEGDLMSFCSHSAAVSTTPFFLESSPLRCGSGVGRSCTISGAASVTLSLLPLVLSLLRGPVEVGLAQRRNSSEVVSATCSLVLLAVRVPGEDGLTHLCNRSDVVCTMLLSVALARALPSAAVAGLTHFCNIPDVVSVILSPSAPALGFLRATELGLAGPRGAV